MVCLPASVIRRDAGLQNLRNVNQCGQPGIAVYVWNSARFSSILWPAHKGCRLCTGGDVDVATTISLNANDRLSEAIRTEYDGHVLVLHRFSGLSIHQPNRDALRSGDTGCENTENSAHCFESNH
jgi:hypothetical protein